MYAAAAKTTRKLNILPETALAPESLLVVAAGSAVALRVGFGVRDAAVVVEVLLSGLSNKMCGENPLVASAQSASLVSVDEVDSSSSTEAEVVVCAFLVVVVGA